MSSCRRHLAAVAACIAVLPAGMAAAAPGDFVLGAGVEGDSEDGLAFSLLGDVAVAEETWLSASAVSSGFELPNGESFDNLYADLGIDHFFDPVGLRFGVAYWGDPDLLESSDLRAAIYFRGERGSLTINGENRDFDFNIPARDTLPATSVGFKASGLGLSASVAAGDALRLHASGMRYDYSRDFRIGDAPRILDLLTFSRLSVLSSLVDWRAGAGLSVDIGQQRWQVDLSRWRGAVDKSDNVGATLSYLRPLTRKSDVEISLGYDDSDLYGDVSFLSVFVFFYGAD